MNLDTTSALFTLLFDVPVAVVLILSWAAVIVLLDRKQPGEDK